MPYRSLASPMQATCDNCAAESQVTTDPRELFESGWRSWIPPVDMYTVQIMPEVLCPDCMMLVRAAYLSRRKIRG